MRHFIIAVFTAIVLVVLTAPNVFAGDLKDKILTPPPKSAPVTNTATATCGNGKCESGESWKTCPGDCKKPEGGGGGGGEVIKALTSRIATLETKVAVLEATKPPAPPAPVSSTSVAVIFIIILIIGAIGAIGFFGWRMRRDLRQNTLAIGALAKPRTPGTP